MGTLTEQAVQASNILGLLLALDTLFTAEQARRLGEERIREGGARSIRLKIIRSVAIGLLLVTTMEIVALLPLAWEAFGTFGGPGWQPLLAVFELTWLLLIALGVWQFNIAWKSGK